MRESAVNIGRVAFGLLAAVALSIQGYHVATQNASISNFFSYFTNLSNIAGCLVLMAGGVLGLTGRRGVPDELRGAIVLYMTITGLIYALLLSDYDLGLLFPWVNNVVHRLMPLVYIADWLLAPPSRRLDRRTVLGWLAFPILYLTYSLIRGPIVDWYPYPFLDPARPGGYGRVAGACTMITALFVAVAFGVVWAGNRLGRRPAAASAVHT